MVSANNDMVTGTCKGNMVMTDVEAGLDNPMVDELVIKALEFASKLEKECEIAAALKSHLDDVYDTNWVVFVGKKYTLAVDKYVAKTWIQVRRILNIRCSDHCKVELKRN